MTAKANRTEVQKYFPYCPLCSERAVEGRQETWTSGDDVAICNACGAKWHTYISGWTDKMQWAELIQVGTKGGENLLGAKHPPEFWRAKALDRAKQKTEKETDVAKQTMVREIVREKEVVIKVRCPYCHKLYDETLDKCPHCSGSR